jgi:hypothetical protein
MNTTNNNDEGFNMSRDQLMNRLKDVIATVTFKKKDGSLREMRCTLKESHLPSFDLNTVKTRKDNLDVLPVWDIENGEWRSFRIDSIKTVSFS